MFQDSSFPQGVVIFFRSIASDNTMARSVHLSGRYVTIGRHNEHNLHEDDYVVLDENGKFLGCFPREFVSAILPLETTGPGVQPHVDNRSQIPQH